MSESNRKKNKLCEDKDDEKGKQSETSSCQMDIEIVLGGETSFNNDQKNEEVKKIRGIDQDTGENLFNFPEGDKYLLRKRKIPNPDRYEYCHHCGNPCNKDYHKCSSPSCDKIYCNNCIKNHYSYYGDYITSIKNWRCFFCNKCCKCPNCKSKKSKNKTHKTQAKVKYDFEEDFYDGSFDEFSEDSAGAHSHLKKSKKKKVSKIIKNNYDDNFHYKNNKKNEGKIKTKGKGIDGYTQTKEYRSGIDGFTQTRKVETTEKCTDYDRVAMVNQATNMAEEISNYSSCSYYESRSIPSEDDKGDNITKGINKLMEKFSLFTNPNIATNAVTSIVNANNAIRDRDVEKNSKKKCEYCKVQYKAANDLLIFSTFLEFIQYVIYKDKLEDISYRSVLIYNDTKFRNNCKKFFTFFRQNIEFMTVNHKGANKRMDKSYVRVEVYVPICKLCILTLLNSNDCFNDISNFFKEHALKKSEEKGEKNKDKSEKNSLRESKTHLKIDLEENRGEENNVNGTEIIEGEKDEDLQKSTEKGEEINAFKKEEEEEKESKYEYIFEIKKSDKEKEIESNLNFAKALVEFSSLKEEAFCQKIDDLFLNPGLEIINSINAKITAKYEELLIEINQLDKHFNEVEILSPEVVGELKTKTLKSISEVQSKKFKEETQIPIAQIIKNFISMIEAINNETENPESTEDFKGKIKRIKIALDSILQVSFTYKEYFDNLFKDAERTKKLLVPI